MRALTPRERAVYEKIDRERPRCCVLCLAGAPGGDNDCLGGHNHIVPRSRLPGKKNWARLWRETNVALSCRYHHELHGHQPIIWQEALIALGYAKPSDYE